MQGGGGPAEPVLSKQSVLTDGVKATAKGGEPAPVRVSETGRARNWTMPPLRLERECKEHSAEQNDLLSFCERRNSATIDNRCVEFDRRESTESTAIIGLRALGRRIAFTMAEILLSLTIIGVVAAITLPSLTGNINERTWNTQRKALYARMSQAISLMPAINGYGTLTEGDSSTSAEDTAAETFITAGLSKVMKINNICDSEHLADCGIASKIITLKGETISEIPKTLVELNDMFNGSFAEGGTSAIWSYSQIDTKAAAFETGNGESILTYYNPKCVGSLNESSTYYVQPKMCANFVYDLNGSKGPNTIGKDMGIMTVMYPSDPVVAAPVPLLYTTRAKQQEAGKACTASDSESRMPTFEELVSLWTNRSLIGYQSSWARVWSSGTVLENGELKGRQLDFPTGAYRNYPREDTYTVICVKR